MKTSNFHLPKNKMLNPKNPLQLWCALGIFALFIQASSAQASDTAFCRNTVYGHATDIVNNQCWTTENLDVINSSSSTASCNDYNCYGVNSNSYAINPRGSAYGYLYTYNAAVLACDALGDGWGVPTYGEWSDLGVSFNIVPNTCDANNNCTYYLEGGADIKDDLNINYFGGNYYPGSGYTNLSTNTDGSSWHFGAYWSDTTKHIEGYPDGQAHWAYLFYNESTQVRRQGMHTGYNNSYAMLSVRCVRDLHAPVIDDVQSLDASVDNDEDTTIKIRVDAGSDVGDSLNYHIVYNGIYNDAVSNVDNVLTFNSISVNSLSEGTNTFKLYATDSIGTSAPYEFTVSKTVYITSISAPDVDSADDMTDDRTPTWTWTSSDANGDGIFRYKLNDGSISSSTSMTSYTPSSPLSYGVHTLYVQERFNDNEWSDFSEKAVEVREALNPDVAASPRGGEYSDQDLVVELTAYTDENKTTESPNTRIQYKLGGAASWTDYDDGDEIPVLANARTNEVIALAVMLNGDGSTLKQFEYKLVSDGEEDQILNIHEEEEVVENVAHFSLAESNVNKLSAVEVKDDDEEEEIKLNLSKVATTDSGKKTVTLTGDNEKLEIKRKKSGIAVEFDLRGTKLTADQSWSGEVIVPTITDSPSGYGITDDDEIKTIFKIGDLDNDIALSKAARIIIPNEGERMAMYYDKANDIWVDVPACDILGIDTQDDANQYLDEGGDCYTEEGGDMVIYTKHFSFFSTFVSNIVSNSSDSSGATYSISKGLIAAARKFSDMLGGASQRIMVASGLNLEDVVRITRDGKVVSIEDIIDTASGSAAVRTNRLVSFAIGDTISTTSAGELDVDLGGFTKMHIAANSKVTIKEAKNDQIIYSQGDGEIRYEFDNQDTDMSWEVRTKSVNAVIRGTIIDVLVQDGAEIYDLIKGTIDIEDGRTGDTYSLEAGQRLKVDEDGNILIGEIGDDLAYEESSESAGTKYRRPVNFRDVPTGQWFTEAVMALKNNRIIKGYTGNYFKPSQAITRAEALKIVLMANDAEIETDISVGDLLSDVTKSDWFANYVVTADKQNIVSGYEDGTFRPGYSITRAEALKIILKSKGITVSGGGRASQYFSDVDADDWFASYVVYAYENDMINGYEDGTFHPNSPVTRAEFAKMISDINGI